VLAPTIAVGPPDDLAGSRAAVARIREYAWVVFTSRNGVDTFFDELARTGGDARRIGGTRVAAIGPKTADALAARGIRVDFVPPRYVSEEVADGLLARSHAGEPILLFRAQEARDALPQALRSHGRPTDVVAAYKTVLIEDPRLPRTAAACDVWTFTSASTVRGFARNLGSGAVLADAASGKQVACIGPVTAEAAREAGLPVDVVADDYTADGLLEALERVAATAEPASAPSG
jgi:uroporphyrinogen-III synthase